MERFTYVASRYANYGTKEHLIHKRKVPTGLLWNTTTAADLLSFGRATESLSNNDGDGYENESDT